MALTSRARSAYLELQRGQATDRAAAALPQTATGGIFTVAGGRVLLLGLLGEITVIFGGTASNLNLVHTPTVGVVGALCAVAATASLVVGTLFGITGVPADALSILTAYAPLADRHQVLPAGVIGLQASGSNTGSAKWRCFWLPVDVGATVTAV
jgi:hypothetical protein